MLDAVRALSPLADNTAESKGIIWAPGLSTVQSRQMLSLL